MYRREEEDGAQAKKIIKDRGDTMQCNANMLEETELNQSLSKRPRVGTRAKCYF